MTTKRSSATRHLTRRLPFRAQNPSPPDPAHFWHTLTQGLIRVTSVCEMAECVTRLLAEETGAVSCALLMRSGPLGTLEVIGIAGKPHRNSVPPPEKMGTRHRAQPDRSDAEGAIAGSERVFQPAGLPRSLLSVPIERGGRMIGAINLTCTVDTNFSDHDERLVSRVAERITPTLERVRLSDDRGDHRFTSPSLTADREIRYATSTAAEWRTVTTGPPVVEDVAPDGAPRRRVLVVDDEPLVLDLVEAVLSDSDCAVQCVRSGEEAIRRLNAENFDLLISDLRMPGIGGLDLVEWMRSVGNNSEVLFMTGEINGGDLKDLVAQSGVTFLSKPFRIGELLDAVESLFKLSTREGLRSHR